MPAFSLMNSKALRVVTDLGFWILDFGLETRDPGLGILDPGLFFPDFGFTTLDFGPWTLDLTVYLPPATSSAPSTPMTLPLTHPAPSAQRATSAPATSEGTVIRPAGCILLIRSIISSLPGILRSAGVSVTPARSALTAMRCGASSTASWRT